MRRMRLGRFGELAEGHFNLTIVEMIDEIRTAEREHAKIDARRALLIFCAVGGSGVGAA
jgi:hypothetical protein